jgi:hypothetical protein
MTGRMMTRPLEEGGINSHLKALDAFIKGKIDSRKFGGL